jgi:hypothetical protein
MSVSYEPGKLWEEPQQRIPGAEESVLRGWEYLGTSLSLHGKSSMEVQGYKLQRERAPLPCMSHRSSCGGQLASVQ